MTILDRARLVLVDKSYVDTELGKKANSSDLPDISGKVNYSDLANYPTNQEVADAINGKVSQVVWASETGIKKHVSVTDIATQTAFNVVAGKYLITGSTSDPGSTIWTPRYFSIDLRGASGNHYGSSRTEMSGTDLKVTSLTFIGGEFHLYEHTQGVGSNEIWITEVSFVSF